MKCEECRYKQDIGNTKETGAALCSRDTSYFPINCGDDCHFLPPNRELFCRDCVRFTDDTACMTMEADDSAFDKEGHLCPGFIDLRENELIEILMFWKTQGLYDRAKIEGIINDFEEFYNDIKEQEE